MKKLIVYTLFFWILLPITSQAMFRKTFNVNNTFSRTNKFSSQNFRTSPTQRGMNQWWKKSNKPSIETKNQNEPSTETKSQFTQLEQLDKYFSKIEMANICENGPWTEYKVSSENFDTILKHIDNIKSEDINKPLNTSLRTFLNKCIDETSHFPDANAEKIINKMLEKGAKIDNPQAVYFPLWLAVLRGNAGAYNALINHSPETHLSKQYEGKVLKLPHVVGFGLNRLKTMEDHYSSELQKIKNGERLGYTYSSNDWEYKPYHKEIPYRLQCATWYKNKFQKIQDRAGYKYNIADNEPLISSFLEERCYPFREYAHGKMHEENFFDRKNWD